MNLQINVIYLTLCVSLYVLVVGCSSNVTTIESRLTPGRILDDELLTKAIQSAIRDEFRHQEYPIQINTVVLDGRVFLFGSAQTQAQKDLASEIVGDFRHVRSIHNELQVGELRTSTNATADRRIATTARLVLLNDPRTRAQEDLHLYTHKGIVYLIGITPRSVAAAAADIVKYVRGVQSVVLLVDYLD